MAAQVAETARIGQEKRHAERMTIAVAELCDLRSAATALQAAQTDAAQARLECANAIARADASVTQVAEMQARLDRCLHQMTRHRQKVKKLRQ